MEHLIDQIAEKASKHKIIPFIGAGCSTPMLHVDWDSLVKKMKAEISSQCEGHLEIAQDFVDKRGKKSLCNFLQDYLTIEEFEDEKGYSYLALLAMGIKLIYTTNQDNVMEQCMKKYGRPYRKIVSLEDLGVAEPGDSLYIKFHGDLSIPESVVFAKNDYNHRMSLNDYFLDIKIRADLLGKSLLFIGYSFRDDNVKQIFQELHHAFRCKLPKSYLIAYIPSEELETVCLEYGIEYIAPLRIFPNLSYNEAFEKYLYQLVEKTFSLKTTSEIGSIFRPNTPSAKRVLSGMEIGLLSQMLDKEELTTAIGKFRAKLDHTIIPKDYEEEIIKLFCEMCRRCENNDQIMELNGAAFNLFLNKKESRLDVYVHLMAIGNRHTKQGSMDWYHVTMPSMPREYDIVFVAMAIDILRNWGDAITDDYREFISQRVDHSKDLNELSKEEQRYVKEQLDYAWEGKTTYEHPLKRQNRIRKAGYQFPGFAKDYDSIMKSMMSSLPKEFTTPYEE
ncbi:SIR2 family NAD-dependent protein deacylase [Desulfotruncus alcoholivorax]|uniref:SIR2 family NAD-dependent protein deacylase n=1 Tax=Desulfotruncus alcoholivorax TaxID=265477 RepID=UPI00041653F1|nr:SIR2 family protein [Desulfotruncus alcoholivorax]